MGVILWGAFIEKEGLSEEEILENLGYHTERIEPKNLGFESAVRYLLKPSVITTGNEIFTCSTNKEYLILIDHSYSKIGINPKVEAANAKHFSNQNVYKFEYDNNINVEAFSRITRGILRRYIYWSENFGQFDYGKRIEIEPDTSVSYPVINLFGEKDSVVLEKHNAFRVLTSVIENMLEKVTGKGYKAEYYHLDEMRLDRRLIKKNQP